MNLHFSNWLNEIRRIDREIPTSSVLWSSKVEDLVFGKTSHFGKDSFLLPVFPSLTKIYNSPIECFHITNPRNFSKLIKLQHSKRSVSCATALDNGLINYGISGSGVIAYLSGELLLGGLGDLGTVPDEHGHRWISSSSFSYVQNPSDRFLGRLVGLRADELQRNIIKKYKLGNVFFKDVPNIVDAVTKNKIISDYINGTKNIWKEIGPYINKHKDLATKFSYGEGSNEVLVNNIEILFVIITNDPDGVVEETCKENNIEFRNFNRGEAVNWLKLFIQSKQYNTNLTS